MNPNASPARRHDERLPGFLPMLATLVGGGALGGLVGFLVGAPLAHRFGLTDASGGVGLFVLFGAVPGCALFGAALALFALFRLVRGAAPAAAAWLTVAALGGGLALSGAPARAATPTTQPAGGLAMQLTSSAFDSGGAIPAKHTSDGPDVAPALQWSHAPAGTKSFALVVDDPDAPDPANPKMTWVHWVLYDLPADTHALPEAVNDKTLPKGARNGINDWKGPGYRGPSPPIGRHRYFFKLYALDAVLGDLKQPTKATLLLAMKGHVLAEAELVGTYAKPR